jgi:PKD repeat protein
MLHRLRNILLLIIALFSVLRTAAQIAMPDNVCQGSNKHYWVDPNPIPGSTYTWKIDGVTQIGYTSNLIDITWNNIGTYILEVQEVSANGCLGPVRTGQITVNPWLIPSISITADQVSTCTGYTVTFTSTVSGQGANPSYQWLVNGLPVGPNSPTWSTNTLQNYDVVSCVLTSDYICADPTTATSNQITMIVLPSPHANFTFNSACIGQLVHFINASTPATGVPITGYQWNINGSIFTTQNADYTFTSSGTFPVSLIVYSANGCSNQKDTNVIVNPPPDVDFTFASTGIPLQFSFSAIVNPLQNVGNNLVWQFGDGTSPAFGTNVTHTFPGPGTFTVRVTGTDMVTGCSNFAEHDVTTIGPLPSAFFTASPANACQGTPISFTSGPPNGSILTEHWDYHDGTFDDFAQVPPNPLCCPANPTHTFANSGPYHVTRTINAGTATEASWDVYGIIYQKPTAQFTWFSDPSLTWQGYACADQYVFFKDQSFSNTTPPGNIYKWQWDFGDPASGPANNSSQLQDPSHLFSASNTTFHITLIVWDNLNDCQDTITRDVFINPVIPVDFTFNDNTCIGNLVTFIPDPTLIPADYTWLWNFGDGSPTSAAQGTVSHLYSTPGTWTVTLTLTDRYGCSKTKQHEVNIIPLPVANFTFTAPTCQGNPIQFTDLSTAPAGYPDVIVAWNWDFGDGVGTSTVQNPSYTYSSFVPAGYNVTLTVTTSRGCVASKTQHVQTIPAPVANFEVLPQTPTCASQVVHFHDLSQQNGGGNITTWLWDFGDPGSGLNNTSPAQNPSHTFAAAGSYMVTLTVTNSNGCYSSKTIQVDITTQPVASFTVSGNCEGNPVQFTNTSTTPPATTIVSYNWDFGDGGTSNVANPQHTYSAYGTKNVSLTVVNSSGCSGSVQQQVTVFANPVAQFIYSSTTCIGNPVTFTDQSTVPGTFSGYINLWTWDFGDGQTQTFNWPSSPNTTHIFQGTATSHVVRLTVTTINGCSAMIEHTVNSTPSPVANFSHSNTTCMGQPVQFTDLTSTNGGPAIQSWLWNFDDFLSGASNTSTLQNPQHIFATPGPHNVTLTVTSVNGCTSTYAPAPVVINVPPVSDFTYTPSCEGSGTQFTDASTPSSAPIISYLWDFGDGSATSNQQNPSHVYLTYGTKNVRLTVTNELGCVRDTLKQVTVYPKPVPAFSYTAPNCLGTQVQFTDQSSTITGFVGPIVTWIWSYGDGSPNDTIHAPGNPNVIHTFLGTSTTHTVRLTVITSNGCSAFIDHVVSSVPAPIANFGFPASTCTQQSVQFTDLSQSNGGNTILQWNWNFGDPASGSGNTSAAQNPVHFFTGPGQYTVTLTVVNASNCSSVKDTVIHILTPPVANFVSDSACLGSITTFASTSTGVPIGAYLWDFGDGGTAVTQNPTHLYLAPGTYPVRLTVTSIDGCTKDTVKPVIVIPKPVAAFSTSAPACTSDSIHFTDMSSASFGYIRTWVWNFGDGQSQTINFPNPQNVTHHYANSGTYNATLTITTSDNCTAQKTLPVVIEAAPMANFSYGNNRCATMPVTFTDLSQTNGGSAITQWLWNFGDPGSGVSNTSNVKNPSHIFSVNGTYHVVLKVINSNGCTDTIEKPVIINIPPVAKFSSDTACIGTPTHFTDSSVPNAPGQIMAWSWNFGDPASGAGNTSSMQNPSHLFSGQGIFYVTLAVTNSNGCINDTVIPVTVNPKPTAMFQSDAACVGDSTSFTDLSISPGSTISSWLWDFGDGGRSTLQNPKHAFASSGTYNVQLIVTNLLGCSGSITMAVNVRPKPVAAYIYTSLYCPAGLVNFEDQSQGVGTAITSRYWIFEPGYTSTLPNPTYTFPVTDTSYMVMLIVTDNNGCKDTVVNSVYVQPGFRFTFKSDSVCFRGVTQFNAINLTPGDSLYNLRWNFGDPNSGPANYSTSYNPTHQYTFAGTHEVQLRVVNSNNCPDSIHHKALVYHLPQPTFTYSSQACDSLVQFHDLSLAQGGAIEMWKWDFGDGTPPVSIPSPGPGNTTHIFDAQGPFRVGLTITNSNGCEDTVSQMVTTNPCITASFASNDSLLCARYPLVFTDNSGPVDRISRWQWIFGDGTDTLYTSYASSITHSYANSGTYLVRLIISTNVNGYLFVDTMKQTVTVHPAPLAQFTNPAACLKQMTLFTDSSLTYGANIVSWRWNFGEPSSGVYNSSLVKDPSHTYGTTGIFDVSMIVTNKFGCKDTTIKPTTVHALPEAHFTNTVACSGHPTYFQDATKLADTSIFAWHWNFGEPRTHKDTSLRQNPVYQYSDAGTFNVRLIVKDKNGCYDTADSTVIVHLSPLSAFTVTELVDNMSGRIRLNNQSHDADTYYWDFGDPSIPNSTEENPVVTYSNDGTYLIMLVSVNSDQCADTTYYKYEVLFKGLFIPNAFAPTSGVAGVAVFKPVGINIKQGTYHIEVYDNWSHLMWQSSQLDSSGRPVESWDGKDLKGNDAPSGTYVWKASAVFTDDSVWTGSSIGKGEYKTIGTVTLIR